MKPDNIPRPEAFSKKRPFTASRREKGYKARKNVRGTPTKPDNRLKQNLLNPEGKKEAGRTTLAGSYGLRLRPFPKKKERCKISKKENLSRIYELKVVL